ncbi:NUDIX domain-containing protein [Microbacterium sp.]|uniref:NUDIX domain-containing protein n=1 Tax=Microbacterium sp. TaxID=51671 RepID=UPI002B92C7E7|nr:NUDIX domain-containing protein [Microbacterium sp.]HWL79131.1 NUDIX domain-containing protein [Microbacterium sp.]
MAVTSAGILLYRLKDGAPEVLIAHLGGPYWASKDEGAWSVPKGEYDADSESALDAAKREFREELGIDPPEGPFAELGTFPYSSGKRVTVFVADGASFELDGLEFGEFELEWPPRSGRTQTFPEVDRVEWVSFDEARGRLVKGQRPAIDRLEEQLAEAS